MKLKNILLLALLFGFSVSASAYQVRTPKGQADAVVLINPTTGVQSAAPVAPTDISGTITTGGAAQTIAVANENRRGFWVMNLSSGSLWLNEITTATQASPSIEIKPGQLYESPYGGTSKNALSLIGATTGQAFAAREW